MKSYSHILAAVSSEVWALQPEKLAAMIGFLQLKAQGLEPELNVITAVKAASIEAAARSQKVSANSSGAVAVLPLFGLIMQRGNMMGDISGPRGTSVEQFTQQFRAAVNDPGIKAIVIDIDSPGGCVSGVPELAAEILQARKTSGKQIVAICDTLCASAAYYIAASCNSIVASPSSLTGSIGVYTAHEDMSEALKQKGVNVTLVSHGKHKVDGNNLGPLSDDARQDMQDRVSYYGDMFERHVAKGRGMKLADVQSKLGQGKVFNATKAKSTGMVDSIGTLDDVLASFGVTRQPQSGGRRARFEDNNHAESSASASERFAQYEKAGLAPHQIRALEGMESLSAKAAKQECICKCDPCEDGDCSECTTPDCSFAGCTCDAATENNSKAVAHAHAQAQHAHREREIELALMH